MATILVVDDVDYIREGVELILAGQGHRVCLAVNGADGVRRYAEERPDLVLLDISMPVLDGWSALAQIRAFDAGARVIMHSGFVGPDERRRAAESGAVAALSKNLDPERLALAVAEALGGLAE